MIRQKTLDSWEAMRLTQKRLTWTSYHHPSTQSWPTWPGAAIPGEGQSVDPYHDILCNVSGVENVRVARRVENTEQAAYIVLWSSDDALASFQASALCPKFLEALPLESARLEADHISPLRTISLQFDHGFDMDAQLWGRVTLNKFTGIGTWESWHWRVMRAIGRGLPLDCADIFRKRPPIRSFCTAWVDQQGGEPQGRQRPSDWMTDAPKVKKVMSQGDERVRERWDFIRWNEPIYYGATREREEESTKQPGAMQHWAEAMQHCMPPVQTWAQERWDIEKPYFPIAPDEDEDDVDIAMDDLDLDEDEDDEYSETEEDPNSLGGIR